MVAYMYSCPTNIPQGMVCTGTIKCLQFIHSYGNEALQGVLGSQEHTGENAREQVAIGQNCPGAGSMGGRKQRNLGSMTKLAKEQTKYNLGSRDQTGHFTMGAGSMVLPLQSLKN